MEEGKKIKKLFKKLCKSEGVLVPKEGRIELPETEGVYLLLNKKDEVLLVGKTEGGKGGLRSRINSQLFGASPFRKMYLLPSGTDIRKKHYVHCLAIESERDRILVEAYAMGKLCPEFIGMKLAEEVTSPVLAGE
jgi:excinuclease UvrABC nuclease subunit